ncbi:hypothetical protein D9M68_604200 [compost metagenome]
MADTVVPDVVLGTGVASEGHRVSVGFDHVVSLHEGFQGELPIGVDALADVSEGEMLLRLPGAEVLGQHAQRRLQRRCVEIRVDEDEAAPGGHLGLRQGVLVDPRLDMGEVPVAGHVVQAAVDIPFPGMERTTDMLAATLAVAQTRTPVQTGVVEGAKLVLAAADDEEGHVADVVRHPVADLRDVFLAAGELPSLVPQQFLLQRGDGRIVVATHGDQASDRLMVANRFQGHGQLVGVAFEQVGHQRAGLGGMALDQRKIGILHYSCPHESWLNTVVSQRNGIVFLS